MQSVLVIEDRETTRQMIEETLRRRGYGVRGAGTVADGRRLLDADPLCDFLLTDLQLPDGSGLELLRHALERDARLPVIVMSAFGTIEIAVEAIKNGAYDFVPKPFDNRKLVQLVKNALARRPRATDPSIGGASPDDAGGIHGTSEAIGMVIRHARRVAPSDASVLLLGESGTGKELVARAIHRWSGRADGPLIVVNCAAVPRELMETEFFGSERGAFTGAVARKLGKVELASGGTLFLDEVGELPPELQPKLLRVLQERSFTRIGGTEELSSDTRVIAATNSDLETQVAEGTFREDLYYRLNVFPIRLPALRERPEDVDVLVAEFLAEEAGKRDRPDLRLSAAAMDALRESPWPGNVRQLRNTIERAVILVEGPEIGPEHLHGAGGGALAATGRKTGPAVSSPGPGAVAEATEPVPAGMTLLDVGRSAARHAESEAILRALKLTEGNKTRAAERLGISYKTLWAKLKEYELE